MRLRIPPEKLGEKRYDLGPEWSRSLDGSPSEAVVQVSACLALRLARNKGEVYMALHLWKTERYRFRAQGFRYRLNTERYRFRAQAFT
jgi:hypothetical protein